jgi:hypothetical protein
LDQDENDKKKKINDFENRLKEKGIIPKESNNQLQEIWDQDLK